MERSVFGPRPSIAARSPLRRVALVLGMVSVYGCASVDAADDYSDQAEVYDDSEASKSALYTQTGTDRPFSSLIADGTLPVGKSSSKGVTGSTIKVNNSVVENLVKGPIPVVIKIHALPNSSIGRSDFPKWTRWYQEDGKTQVFRLFKGEYNVHNSRPKAARIEAFTPSLKWRKGPVWHEWTGKYTIVKPHGGSIFQAMNSVNQWAVAIILLDNGDIKLNHRRGQADVIIARSMKGKSFDLKVRDNGHDYEVYYNNQSVGKGSYDRPKGDTNFRWGMYVGNNSVTHDAMIFVSGVTFK